MERLLKSLRFQESQINIGWTEEHCARLDAIAAEAHVNNAPTNTARTELHSMITFHHANTRGSRCGRLKIITGGVAQAFHDDRVVELKEQLVVEEVDGEGQEGKAKEEGRGRIKENKPWMAWRWL